MSKFILAGGERSALASSVYIAERLFEGNSSNYSGPSKKYMLKNETLCKSGDFPSGQVQVFDDGGKVITGTIRGESGTVDLYLGHPISYDMEHSFEGGAVSAKFQKNGVTLADDVSSFNLTMKFQMANIGADELRELMFVANTVAGVRNISATPNTLAYNKDFLVSHVTKMANGDYSISQVRKARITIGLPSGGGGEEHQKAEVTITPIRDPWAEEGYNYMGDVILTGATIA